MATTINCFIPKEITVGFRKRNTKTGRLAFITYNDERGKMKFETSFSNWIDHEIPLEHFENSIMTTLYIGNAAGGCKSGWNFRQEYIQISDDRGITFEIPTNDFLELLDYSIVDHGTIKGEFVFGWYSNNLTVVSTEFPWYESVKEYSNNINNEKITKASQMIPGRVYKLKNYPWDLRNKNDEFTFIGNLPTINYDLNTSKSRLVFVVGDTFFFSDIKNIEFEVKNKESLSKCDLQRYIERFEHSPYSKRWWKEYRFKSKLIPVNHDINGSNWDYIRLYATTVDEEGNIYSHALQEREVTRYSLRWSSNNSYIEIKPNDVMNKSICWFNILKDDPIKIPLRYTLNYNNYCPDGVWKEIDKEYVKWTLNMYETIENWKEIKKFIDEHTVDKYCDFKNGYHCECDGWKFNLSNFILKGFCLGTGNFSVNEKYMLPMKCVKIKNTIF